jgi:two-component system sensor histidine kinase CiaH
MITKLRIRFIGTATVSILIVIAVALALINISVVKRERRLIDQTLNLIEANGGTLGDANFEIRLDREIKESDKKKLYNELGPEFAFQLRFFSVNLTEKNDIIPLDTRHIATFTENDISEYVKLILDRLGDEKTGEGMLTTDKGSYAYRVSREGFGRRVLVLDCTSNLSNTRATLIRSVRYGIIGVLFFMLVAGLLSKRALRTTIRSIESQKKFITNAGHELKTPLAVISANVDILEITEGKNEWLTSIRNQVTRLTGLVNRLIRLAKIDENPEELVLNEIDYSSIAEEAVSAFKPIAKEAGKTLVSDIEDGVKVIAEADCLYELISILLDNACKYCDENGKIRVELRRERSIAAGKTTRLEVSNDYAEGSGLDYTMFFERFYREDESRNTSKNKGYGIGLPIARELASLFKGDMDVSYSDGIISFIVLI